MKILVVIILIVILGCISRQTIIINSPDSEISDTDGLIQIEQEEDEDEKITHSRSSRNSKHPVIDKLREEKP